MKRIGNPPTPRRISEFEAVEDTSTTIVRKWTESEANQSKSEAFELGNVRKRKESEANQSKSEGFGLGNVRK